MASTTARVFVGLLTAAGTISVAVPASAANVHSGLPEFVAVGIVTNSAANPTGAVDALDPREVAADRSTQRTDEVADAGDRATIRSDAELLAANQAVDSLDPGAPMDLPYVATEDLDHTAELAQLAAWWMPAQIAAQAPMIVLPADDASYLAELAAAGVTVSELGWVNPVQNGRFTSSFGMRGAFSGISAGFHNGIDLAAPLGYPIRAAAAGTVVYVGNSSAQYGLTGWVIAVDHGDGVVTTYNHMAQAGVLVNVGDQVRTGQIVGLIGSEGRATGPHLHFAVHVAGQAVDPVPFMLSKGIDLKAGTAVTPVALSSDWLAAQKLYAQRVAVFGKGSGPSLNLTAGAQVPQPQAPVTVEPSPQPSPTTDPAPDPTPSVEPTPEPSPSVDPTSDPTPSVDPTEQPSPTSAPEATSAPEPAAIEPEGQPTP